MARVLVIGASRGIGLETVNRALEVGHHVRAFARSASRIGVAHPQLEIIVGDALEAAAVGAAIEGQDAVIQTLGADAFLSKVETFSRATRILVDAMTAKGPRRLLSVTGFGAGETRGRGGLLYDFFVMPLVLKRVYDDKDVQERIIRSSGLDWTIVRPGYLTNRPFTGRIDVIEDPARWRLGSISRKDVAAYLVGAIADEASVGKAVVLAQRR
ncbi:MAG: NAD(P)H-binding protein [Hyphomicrobiaceae bacterium]|nr:MAG: NAD(P)H-binding protein [Hyphomicrobiaceae bacterium]